MVQSLARALLAIMLIRGWQDTPSTGAQWPDPGESALGLPASTCTICSANLEHQTWQQKVAWMRMRLLSWNCFIRAHQPPTMRHQATMPHTTSLQLALIYAQPVSRHDIRLPVHCKVRSSQHLLVV